MKTILWWVLGICILVPVMYGATILAKNVSYAFFYEDLVTQTICAEVKKEFLINTTKCK